MTTDNIAKHIIDIVKHRFIWLCVSAILLLPGTAALIYSAIHNENHVPLKVGIDYTGGTILQYGVKENISNSSLSKTRVDLQSIGIDNPYIQILHANGDSQDGINNIISIRTKFIGEDQDTVNKITEALSKDYENPELISVSSVGPTLGNELFKNSLLAITLAFLGIVAYLTIRFKFDYALAAILGIAHDVLFVVGAFSLLGIFYDVQ